MWKRLITILLFMLSSFAYGHESLDFWHQTSAQWTWGYCYKFFIKNTWSQPVKWRTLTFDIDNENMYEKWSANFEKTSKWYKLTWLDWNNPVKWSQEFDVWYCTYTEGRPYNISFEYDKDHIQENNSSSNPIYSSSQPSVSTWSSNTGNVISTWAYSSWSSITTGSTQNTGSTVTSGTTNNGWSVTNWSNTGSMLTGNIEITWSYLSPFIVKDWKIYDSKNQIVQLRWVNWFWFESDIYTVHGLWVRNYKDVIKQMKDLWFNAVRLPFCPWVLRENKVWWIDYRINPDLEGLNSLQLLDKIIQAFAEEWMYVLLDNHVSVCSSWIPETPNVAWYTLDNWISDLTFLANRYKNTPNVIWIDPKNEPHWSAKWGNGDINTDRKMQVEKAWESILKVNPNLLIFIEWISDNWSCEVWTYHWWGGNLEPLDCYPIDNNKIPANKVVLSPHVYWPDVYVAPPFLESNFPSNMPNIWNTHFGKFVGNYAIVPGEFGWKFGEWHYLDATWQKSIIDYFISKWITSFFFWSWNPNSWDTWWILKDDWKTVNTNKLNNLKRLFYVWLTWTISQFTWNWNTGSHYWGNSSNWWSWSWWQFTGDDIVYNKWFTWWNSNGWITWNNTWINVNTGYQIPPFNSWLNNDLFWIYQSQIDKYFENITMHKYKLKFKLKMKAYKNKIKASMKAWHIRNKDLEEMLSYILAKIDELDYKFYQLK